MSSRPRAGMLACNAACRGTSASRPLPAAMWPNLELAPDISTFMPPSPHFDSGSRLDARVFGRGFRMAALLLGLLGSHAGMAQIPVPSAKADAAAPAAAEPTTIPIAEIAKRADEDEAFIQDVTKRSDGGARAASLAQDLALVRRDVEALDQKAQASHLETMPLTNLETLDRYLGFLDRELRQWQGTLQSAARPVSADAAALIQKHKLWSETQTAFAADMVPALAQRIDGLVKAFAVAERAASQPLAQLLALGREASALQAHVNAVAAAVRGRIASIDRRLWQRDADDLFTALVHDDMRKTLDLGELGEKLRAESHFIDEFDRSSRAAQNGVLVLALLLLPVIVVLSTRAKKALAGDTELERHRKALTRPLSAWLLLTLSLLIVVHFLGPATRIKVLLLLAWLPIMRLQPEHIRSLFGRGIYFTGLFIVLGTLGQMVASVPLAYRLVMLSSSLSMFAVLGWLLWRLVLGQRQRTSRVLRMLRNLLTGGTVALAVAVGSNLIGNVSLAAMLTDGVLSSVYTGLFLLAAGNVVRGWLRFVFRPTMLRLKAGTPRAGGLLLVLSHLFEIALFVAWLYFTLDAFRVLRPLQEWMKALFAFSLGFGNISVTVGGITLFWVSVFLSFWIAKTVRGVLAEDVLPLMTLPRGVANSASTMTYYVLLILGLMLALTAAGFELSQVTLVLGALSVGIGFGLQTVVNNFVSGLILMFERPIQPGDTVEVAGMVGTIRDIGMRATTFTTFEGADVVVPNGMLLSEKLINWTLNTTTRRIELPVGVAYGSDPAQVAVLLRQVADATEGVARQPGPSVLFTGFGASSLDFSVRAWASFDDHVFVRSRLALAVHAALKEAGIEIPFPQQDLHLRSVAPGLFDGLQRRAD